jgi:hypothetical protein
MTFPDSVFNPNCPVNLLSVGALHRGKDGKPLDNEISFKSGTFTINVSPATPSAALSPSRRSHHDRQPSSSSASPFSPPP